MVEKLNDAPLNSFPKYCEVLDLSGSDSPSNGLDSPFQSSVESEYNPSNDDEEDEDEFGSDDDKGDCENERQVR